MIEAEYIAACEAPKEAVWLRQFVMELGIMPSISGPMDVYCDNNGAIVQSKEPRAHHRSKHVLRRYHLIREITKRGDVKIIKIPTDNNVADPFTSTITCQA